MNREKLKHYIEYYDLVLNKFFDHENKFYVNKTVETFKPKKISLWKKILFPFYLYENWKGSDDRTFYCHRNNPLVNSSVACVDKITVSFRPRMPKIAFFIEPPMMSFSNTTSEVPPEPIKKGYDDLDSVGFLLKDFGDFELVSYSETYEDFDLDKYIEVNKYEKMHYTDLDKIYSMIKDKLGKLGFNLKKEDFMDLYSGKKIEGIKLINVCVKGNY